MLKEEWSYTEWWQHDRSSIWFDHRLQNGGAPAARFVGLALVRRTREEK
jgi:hypothetical protein